MRITKKWSAVLLVFLLLAQLTPSLAQEDTAPTFSDALAAGQEVSYSMKFDWHSPALFDDIEINATLASLFEAIEIRGYHGQPNDTDAYGAWALLIDGEEALPFEYVFGSNSAYYNSPIYGGGVALDFDDLNQLILNCSAYLATVTDMPADTFLQLFESISAPVDEAAAEDAASALEAEIEEMFALYDLASIMEIVTAWQETALVGEAYTGDIASVFGVETGDATVYEITKAELVELLTAILTEIQGNDALLTHLVINGETPDGQPTPEALDQARAELTSLIESLDLSLPDSMVMRYNECYDADGNHVVSEIEVYVPYDESEDSDTLIVYMEWIPDTSTFYGLVLDAGDGFSFAMQEEAAETVETEEGSVEYSSFTAIASLYEAEAFTTGLTLVCETLAIPTETGVARETVLSLGLAEGDLGEIGSLQIVINQEDIYQEAGLASQIVCDCNLVMNDVSMPLFSAEIGIASRQAQGAPFDPEDGTLTFVQLGKMTEEEFLQWANEDVVANCMKTAMHILSLLPTEVMVTFMQDAELITDVSVDIAN